MRNHRTSRRLALVLGLAAALPVAAADGPIRILVGFPPGGVTDIIARNVAERLRVSLDTTFVIENRPGASGMIAAELLKNAAPDGRTLMVAPMTVTILAPLTAGAALRYDPVRDFVPVSLVARYELALALAPSTPARTLDEYLAWVREDAKRATIGVPLPGGLTHFAAIRIAQLTHINMEMIPYKGSGPLTHDLSGDQLPAGVGVLSDLTTLHRAGRINILATSGQFRSSLTPEVPTFKEMGMSGMERGGWVGFYLPAGVPPATVRRYAAAIDAALTSAELLRYWRSLGIEPGGGTPEDLARASTEDMERWRGPVKASGLNRKL